MKAPFACGASSIWQRSFYSESCGILKKNKGAARNTSASKRISYGDSIIDEVAMSINIGGCLNASEY